MVYLLSINKTKINIYIRINITKNIQFFCIILLYYINKLNATCWNTKYKINVQHYYNNHSALFNFLY